MRTLAALLTCSGLLSTAFALELPNVKRIECHQVPLDSEKCLIIKFNNLEEYAGLESVRGNDNVLHGKLYDSNGKEKADSSVSMTLHDNGDTYVLIADPSDDELYKLKVNLDTGESKLHILPTDGSVIYDEPMVVNEPTDEGTSRISPEIMRQLPPQGFKMRLQIIVDQAFQNYFGAQVQTKVDEIIVHAKTFFAHSQSLTTKFDLIVPPIINIPQTYYATGTNLGSFRNQVSASTFPLANSYSLLSWQGGQSGVVGIAWLGNSVYGSCAPNKGRRTNINEFFGDEVMTAQILVHEIGHNLGMLHDFNGSPSNPRQTSDGQACSGVGGYMDYYNNPNKWSPCSVEDFTIYYNTVKNTQGGQFCMPLITDPTNPTTIPPNPTTTNPTTPNPPSTPNPPTAPGNCTDMKQGNIAWIGDGYCDDRNNHEECEFDGNDCCLTTASKPDWNKFCKECKCKTTNDICTEKQGNTALIGDGYCNDENNNEECEFDGNDCCFRNKLDWKKNCNECKCKAGLSGCKIKSWYYDGWCDDKNNTPECHYDGGDCCVKRKDSWHNYCTVCECKKPFGS